MCLARLSKDAGAARLTFGLHRKRFFIYFAVNASPSSQQTPWKRVDFTRLSLPNNNSALYERWRGVIPRDSDRSRLVLRIRLVTRAA